MVIPSTITYNGKEYNVTSIGNCAFANSYSLKSITIPSSVISIASSAFSGCTGLTKAEFASIESLCNIKFGGSCANPLEFAKHLYINGQEVTNVVIPNGVTSIGDYVFNGGSNLTSITIPNSVTSIGSYAFSGCSKLASVTIPNGVTSIDYYAFCNCYGLKDVYCLAEQVPTTALNAFDNSGITAATLYVPVSAVGLYKATVPWSDFRTIALYYDYDFEADGLYYYINSDGSSVSITYKTIDYNSYFGSIVIPSTVTYSGRQYSVTNIGDYAFRTCSALTSVTIPNSVTSIGSYAFYKCSSLSTITIGNCVTNIGDYAFCSCYNLNSVTIPSSVTSIGNNAFCSCSGLSKVTIGNNVKIIGDNAFDSCAGLTSVTIPNSVTSIGKDAFYRCSALTSVTIQEGVTNIGNYAFANCSDLNSVIIPGSVVSIGESAFNKCENLKSVYINDIAAWCNISFVNEKSNPLYYAGQLFLNGQILNDLVVPEGVTSIGSYAFSKCDDLTSVIVPNSVESIGENAFNNCDNLTSVVIGNSVSNIGSRAFAYCGKLKDICCQAEQIPVTNATAFNNSYPERVTLHVPSSAVADYRVTVPWSNFGNIVTLDGEKPETPTIDYINGQLVFRCNTEDVDFVSEITCEDARKSYTAAVELTATYTITVYAVRANYDRSDVATATLCWIDAGSQSLGIDDIVDAEIETLPVLIQKRGNQLSICTSSAGLSVSVYDLGGCILGTGITNEGETLIDVDSNADIIIVKVGERSIKVKL